MKRALSVTVKCQMRNKIKIFWVVMYNLSHLNLFFSRLVWFGSTNEILSYLIQLNLLFWLNSSILYTQLWRLIHRSTEIHLRDWHHPTDILQYTRPENQITDIILKISNIYQPTLVYSIWIRFLSQTWLNPIGDHAPLTPPFPFPNVPFRIGASIDEPRNIPS